MASGVQLSNDIERGLRDLRKQEDALLAHLKSASDALNGHRTDQAEAYRELASMRLDELDSRTLAQGLDAAEQRATELLAESAEELTALEALNRDSRARLEESEREVDAQTAAVEAAAHTLDEAEAELQATLSADETFKARAADTEGAAQIARQAERKTVLAKEDRIEKGKPYESDALFMYLWNRAFGTRDYRSWGLIKLLDGWVARLCDYQNARSNYAMLLEIPKRLRTHTDQVRERADAALQTLQAVEKKARDEAGVTALEDVLKSEDESLGKLREKAEQVTAEITAEEVEIAEFSRGEDEKALEALRVLADELRRDPVRRLRHNALLTPDPRDDRWVERIVVLDRQIEQAEEDVAVQRESLQGIAHRRAELITVRNDFLSNRYHTDDYDFWDHDVLDAQLDSFLRGTITGMRYWRELERHSHYRPKRRSNSGFGSRGYRQDDSSWSDSSDDSWSSSSSSGGFSSGGGFGGSDFKTGGDF